ncbi:hypothetical protein BDA99DRAFT_603175 [Phascolomyces articulosus]|uniref:Methionine synthase reductase n=1 Tax=Phascolomyces articulosus TaxID=60185 RepID=A0AAD5PGB2_9FUNG|nr:hypothetical protein BDA99DRAFT_603175 [Phascolomyces articulosus]
MGEKASSYTILWASQTGNAEWIAKNIHSEAKERGYVGECFGMDAYEKAQLDKIRVLIAVTSNTGDGDPPDHSLKFWRFMRRNKEAGYFNNCQVAILGLGDTNYSNFNNTAKRLEKKLKSLGATVFYEKGLADDAEGLENVVDPWIEKLWDALPKVLEKKSEGNGANGDVDNLANKVEAVKIEESPTNTNPYSGEERAKNVPPEAQKYLNLENSLIEPTTNPYSGEERAKNIPPEAQKYLNLENSLIEPTTNPYSGEERAKNVPPEAQKYLNLENSLVKNKEKEHLGHALTLDFSGLQSGMQLSGMPRIPAASAKLVRLEKTRSLNEAPTTQCVVTPTPITEAAVSRVQCLTTHDAVKRTLHVELDIGDGLEYEPGDAFGVVAPNDESLVEAVLERLVPSTAEGYQTLYNVEGESLPTHLQNSKSVSLADLLRYVVDLTTPPRKALLRLLAEYTTEVEEKTKLIYICSKQGVSQFNSVREQVPTLLDILKTFPSCNPPVERLLDALPPHMPRYYSIASSPLKYPGKIHFAFNIIDYKNLYDVPRKGVATPWLDQLTGFVAARSSKNPTILDVAAKSIKVPIFRKENANAFTLPSDTKHPLILIGPGTGIAPFIGFLQHRQQQLKIRKSMGGVGTHPSRDIKKEFGDIWVYYGFRERAKDYLFEQELEEFVKDGTITQLRLAVSRESNKVYVQDLMRQDLDKLYDLIINQDCSTYVCGDAKGMAKGVNDVLVEMLVQHHQLDAVAANKLLIEWMGSRKYLRDLWA